MFSNNLKINTANAVTYITFPKLEKTGLVNHLFSTRLGGVSTGIYSSMNVSFTGGDQRENVLENYKRLCNCIDVDINNLVLSRQTHTNNVKVVDKSHCGTGVFKESFNDIDGLITATKNVALVTQYADCTPLIFLDPQKKVIATSHAGWRGTVKEIGKKTVEKMSLEFGCNPSDIIAGIGPCIAKCCYEVDDPVYSEFIKLDYLQIDKIFQKKPNGKYMLNLVEANKQILLNAGLKLSNIDLSDICTCCNAKELHSHRATNGKRGNLGLIIELK
ncbi:MAG: peptidoglycan editing factor PgeF [Ruminococcaceae bacterium]|nr:peptidoglycan editing factor PgeF [Oscillospiraceae bacterium]